MESSAKQDGRNMIMVLGPHKKKTEAMAEARALADARKAERQGRTTGPDAEGDEDAALEAENAALEAEADEADTDEADEADVEDATEVEQPAEASQDA